MESAAGRVFAVPELLEMILLQVKNCNIGIVPAIRHLFILQRANKDFRSSIATSLKLQRDMLLADDGDTQCADGEMCGYEFLLEHQLGVPDLHPALPCLYDDPVADSSTARLEMQLCYRNCGGMHRGSHLSCSCHERLPLSYAQESALALVRARSRGFFLEKASWRRMKLSRRPKCIKLRLLVWHNRPPQQDVYPLHAQLDIASTLGDLYDALAVILGRNKQAHQNANFEVKKSLFAIMDGFSSWETGEHDAEVTSAARAVKQSHAELADCGYARFGCAFCTALRNLDEDGKDYAQFMDQL